MANYRIKPLVSSNLPQGLEIVGRFTLTTAGAVGTVRPSAGSAPSTGAGLLYTVTQLPTAYGGGSGDNCYQVTLAEEYFKVVGTQATYSPAFSLTLGAVAMYDCQATQYDPTTKSFVIYVLTKGTIGGSPDVERANGLAAGEITFQLFAIPTVTQATT